LRKIAELIPDIREIRSQKEFLLIPFDSPIFFTGTERHFRDRIYSRCTAHAIVLSW